MRYDAVEPSLARLHEAREQRRRERERKRAKIEAAGSVEEYHEAKYGDVRQPLQATANAGYSNLKARR